MDEVSYESGERDAYPLDKLQSIAELLGSQVTWLLDGDILFLQEGQGKPHIRVLRKSMAFTQAEFGKLYDVHSGTVKKGEGDRERIYKSTWEKLFQPSTKNKKTR